MINLIEQIKKTVFAYENQTALSPEAIDGGYSERPVSGHHIYEPAVTDDGAYFAAYTYIFDTGDGWDSDQEEIGSYPTYEEALFACFLDYQERDHNQEIRDLTRQRDAAVADANEWQKSFHHAVNALAKVKKDCYQ